MGAEVAYAEPPVIYKWVDEHGVAHFTTDRDRIPAAIRDRLVTGSGAGQHHDWLQRDAGDTAARPPSSGGTGRSASLRGESDAAAARVDSTPAARAPDADVEGPEASDGIHAVASEPDWSEAPGAETVWAPGDLGEEDGGARRPSDPEAADAAGTGPAAAEPPQTAAVPQTVPPPPPPPPAPPLEADGAPVAAPARARSDPDGTRASPRAETPFGARSELPFEEPTAPAAVAAPAPHPLEPDEQAKLEQLDREIAGIEDEIARDEETLMLLLSETEAVEQNVLVDDPRFRDVAQRLPRLQADLERLREQRARIQPSVTRQ
jgi:hypothetical protein